MNGIKIGDVVEVNDGGIPSINYVGKGMAIQLNGVHVLVRWIGGRPRGCDYDDFWFHHKRLRLISRAVSEPRGAWSDRREEYPEDVEEALADPTLKPTNPKDAIGSDKLPLHLWPETATVMGCLGLLEGALKYGRNNWRETGVRASIYVDALRRHVDAYFEGEDNDPDSGMPHLAHALACLAILVDAQAAGRLNDDRNYPGGYRQLVDELTPLVKAAKEHHADKAPKHWTIKDV